MIKALRLVRAIVLVMIVCGMGLGAEPVQGADADNVKNNSSTPPFFLDAVGWGVFGADPWNIRSPISVYADDVFRAVTSGLLAHGRYTGVPDGSKDPRSVWNVAGREFREKRPYVEDASPVHYAAILYSDAVKPYYAGSELRVRLYTYNREDDARLSNIRAAFEVLQKLHVPVEFLRDSDLNLETLKKFKVVIFPNSAVISQPGVAAIRRSVTEGGSILCTYETSLYDESGNRKVNFDLSDVFGLRYVALENDTRTTDVIGKNPCGHCVVPKGDFLAHLQDILTPRPDHLYGPDIRLYIEGPFVTTEPIAGTTQATVNIMNVNMRPVANRSNIPSVHFNNFGRGKSAYISADMFEKYTISNGIQAYPFTRRGWMTDLIAEVLTWLAPNPPIKVAGSPLLECTFFEQKEKGRYIVHLLNSGVVKLGEAFDLEPAKILIRKDFVKPQQIYSAWPERMNLKAEDRGEYLEVRVPKTRIHQIVVVER